MDELYALLLFIGAGLLVLVAHFAWQHHSTKGMLVLMCLALVLAEWCVTDSFFWLATSAKGEFFWLSMTYLARSSAAALFLVFVFFYTGHEHQLKKIFLIGMALESAVIVGLAWIDAGRITLSEVPQSKTSGLLLDQGLVFWLHTIYSYVLIIIAVRCLLSVAVHGPPVYRSQSRSILVAALLPLAVSFANFTRLEQTLNMRFVPLAFTLSGFIIAVSLFRIGILGLVPFARSSVINMLHDSVVVVDQQHQIADVNPAAQRLLTAMQAPLFPLIGQPITSFFSLWLRWIDASTEQTTIPLEIRIEVDNTSRFYDLRVSPLTSRNQKQWGWVLLLHDVTRRKTAERRAFALALEKERVNILTNFIQDASHEFRTPLAIIQSNLYLISKVDDATVRQDKVAVIEKQVARLSLLLDQLAILSKLDSGVILELRTVDIKLMLQQLIEKTTFSSPDIVFRLEADPNLPNLVGDAHLLEEAFEQLLENAVRFCSPNCEIKVRATCQLYQIRIEVSDTGPGIAPDVLSHVFERFYRQDASHNTPGFGLGLPIAQKIIEAHKGTIQIDSQPGQGTTVRVLLPLAQRDAAEPTAAQ
ncbi:MAG TPA: histidine kinase N-terminal 7TM domain-containing protein [Aggregatilineaceae bacterium]|nr:histidine kinase N-terminal 7TM domain-containing protein [Aggregatilineaceae bacterium]